MLDKSGPVRITVHDMLGRIVRTPVDGFYAAGAHSQTFDGSTLSAGIYVYRFESHGVVEMKVMSLLR